MFDETRWIRYGNHDYIRASLKEMCTSRRVFGLSTKIWSLCLRSTAYGSISLLSVQFSSSNHLQMLEMQ